MPPSPAPSRAAGFVDIHSHILPGIDDGPTTIDESLQMLKLAAASGTTELVATPHASTAFPFEPQRIHDVFQELSSRSAGVVNLHLGCDFHLNMQNLEEALAHPAQYTINGGRYLLVELPEFLGFSAIRRQLQTLIHARFRPVITHPERNLQLQSAIDQLKSCVADGCLIQVTAQSLLGRFGAAARTSAERLIKARLVHFLASDAHNCSSRPPDLSAAFEHVRGRWGTATAQTLFIDNPASAVSDTILPERPPAAPWRRLFSLLGR